MKQEINAALDLIVSYVQRFGKVKETNLNVFRTNLEQSLLEKYQGHWYIEKPVRGQAFRSLIFQKDSECDPIIAKACEKAAFMPALLGIQHDITIWIDPREVTIRIGNHPYLKNGQQMLVARFDNEGNELVRHDLDTLFNSDIATMLNVTTTTVTTNNNQQHTSSSSSSSSVSDSSQPCSGSSTPQRTSSPYTMPTMYHNPPLFTPPRTLSPQTTTATYHSQINQQPSHSYLSPNQVQYNGGNYTYSSMPIAVPTQMTNIDTSSPSYGSPTEVERSDTPHSHHSTASSDSTDSGYCGYVESFPYYYKLNRLYKALAVQKYAGIQMKQPMHPNRRSYNNQLTNSSVVTPPLSTTPPTPTPQFTMNPHQTSFVPILNYPHPHQQRELIIGHKTKH
ncbi:unnamed protein product [Didymodactylos carnosus]|uniref:Anti-proliferative protein domain-containing protein n=1 Tax=Didymodactylos carnosus TaxID=1234261 RepID=A0A813TD49_9BILA|nr:unnamed protein product [Didymodactylos carnosus]CAF0999117.1 unnamed protein product [Didymodactylos carnosus]CAF3597941.1 unnamed protein product [Didymodactylos carnosus]CAF3768626.1 unnamed protein product [Didymodactylos carnosus]